MGCATVAFLDSFHPTSYAEWVRDELSNVQLLPHETLQMYANKFKWLINKRAQPSIPQDQVD